MREGQIIIGSSDFIPYFFLDKEGNKREINYIADAINPLVLPGVNAGNYLMDINNKNFNLDRLKKILENL